MTVSVGVRLLFCSYVKKLLSTAMAKNDKENNLSTRVKVEIYDFTIKIVTHLMISKLQNVIITQVYVGSKICDIGLI